MPLDPNPEPGLHSVQCTLRGRRRGSGRARERESEGEGEGGEGRETYTPLSHVSKSKSRSTERDSRCLLHGDEKQLIIIRYFERGMASFRAAHWDLQRLAPCVHARMCTCVDLGGPRANPLAIHRWRFLTSGAVACGGEEVLGCGGGNINSAQRSNWYHEFLVQFLVPMTLTQSPLTQTDPLTQTYLQVSSW
jgi:hypothetical protein